MADHGDWPAGRPQVLVPAPEKAVESPKVVEDTGSADEAGKRVAAETILVGTAAAGGGGSVVRRCIMAMRGGGATNDEPVDVAPGAFLRSPPMRDALGSAVVALLNPPLFAGEGGNATLVPSVDDAVRDASNEKTPPCCVKSCAAHGVC